MRGSRGCAPQLLADAHPDLAAQWHPTLNTVPRDQVTLATRGRHWWTCPGCNQPWQATIAHRITDPTRLCRACEAADRPSIKSLAVHRPDLAAQWHPTLNDISPQEVGIGSRKRVWWLCPDCGHTWQAPVAQCTFRGSGCPPCAMAQRAQPIRKPLAQHAPDLAAQWHPILNPITPDEVGVSSQVRVWWLCPECSHAWQTTVSQRVRQHTGCPQCAIQTRVRTTKARREVARDPGLNPD